MHRFSNFAKIMIHLIDLDTEYKMQESQTGAHLSPEAALRCDSIYHECTEGIAITEDMVRIRLCNQPDTGVPAEESLPTLILFDSLDGKVHPGEEENKTLLYFEYARIRLDGNITECNTRKTQVTVIDQETIVEPVRPGELEPGQYYIVEALRERDHMLVRMYDKSRTIRIILALPDSSRAAYIAIGGENCFIHNIAVENSEAGSEHESIPRIAEEISYIRGCPEGDIPNVQVDGWCSDATEGMRVDGEMTLTFHSMSLPTARLIWHCPYISLYSASDGRMKGENYREYLLLRINGEDWSSDEHVENTVDTRQTADFPGWDAWKDKNKQGIDCSVRIRRENNRITMETENLGIIINTVTTILDETEEVYAAITGDQCAITNIRILPRGTGV